VADGDHFDQAEMEALAHKAYALVNKAMLPLVDESAACPHCISVAISTGVTKALMVHVAVACRDVHETAAFLSFLVNALNEAKSDLAKVRAEMAPANGQVH
jgi:hypothetical protein